MRLNHKVVVPLVNEILDEYDFKLTIRQIYYRLMSHPYNYFSVRDKKYHSLIQMLRRERENGTIDWHRIEDRHRSTHGGDDYFDSPDDFINVLKGTIRESWKGYIRTMWDDQNYKVELWIEKDAESSLAIQVADNYNVLVFTTKGPSSLTWVKLAVERLVEFANKEIVILHFGDHDPSGIMMSRDLQRRFSRYGAEEGLEHIRVKRIGLNMDQIDELNLISSGKAKRTDPNFNAYIKEFGTDEVWEMDALPPDELKSIIVKSINKYVNNKERWNEKIKETSEEKVEVKKKVSEMMSKLDKP